MYNVYIIGFDKIKIHDKIMKGQFHYNKQMSMNHTNTLKIL